MFPEAGYPGVLAALDLRADTHPEIVDTPGAATGGLSVPALRRQVLGHTQHRKGRIHAGRGVREQRHGRLRIRLPLHAGVLVRHAAAAAGPRTRPRRPPDGAVRARRHRGQAGPGHQRPPACRAPLTTINPEWALPAGTPRQHRGTRILQQHDMESAPVADLVPCGQPSPAGHARAETELLGQVLPLDAGVQDEQDPAQGLPVRHSRSALDRSRTCCGQQWLDELPQFIRHDPRRRLAFPHNQTNEQTSQQPHDQQLSPEPVSQPAGVL
ncbi:hypothetical protein QF035_000286 [Streptomyces umbrinus]|uniref:Uncharacterized protein n=1 Tax=Streptomyces umbrinus TaxID=67370 RepID=A0ABU0SJP3_9ACTN|nr:hypothetical protein [Streptomyces umbrinus]